MRFDPETYFLSAGAEEEIDGELVQALVGEGAIG
jgi:hypothetical protein